MKKIRVLHVVAGSLKGGAARGTYWLHLGLLEEGVQSTLLTNKPLDGNYTEVTTLATNPLMGMLYLLRQKLDKVFIIRYLNKQKSNLFSPGIIGVNIADHQQYKQADIVHFHWIHGGFIDIAALKKIDKPVVWTLRDMWAFTGGCHYAIDCDRYQENCGQCIVLGSRSETDLSRKMLLRKKHYYAENIHFVCISEWLARRARQSQVLRSRRIEVIPNGVDDRLFFPVDKQVSRARLNIDTRKKIVRIGAQNLGDNYKGFAKFTEALGFLNPDDYFLVLFGKEFDTSMLQKSGYEVLHLGYIKDDNHLREIYTAADVFVAPSLLEAFGKMVVESMLCGTRPVVFDAAGPGEIVQHKLCGYKAKPYCAKDLARGIRWAAAHSGVDAHKTAQSASARFSNKIAAKSYHKLYQRILRIE